jgi:hypothetical protein
MRHIRTALRFKWLRKVSHVLAVASEEIPAGTRVRVTGHDENLLRVTPISH